MVTITADVIAQCTNTLNKALIAMDLGDGDMFASCFTEDGVCHIAINKNTKTGNAELVALGKALHAKFKHCKHWEGNVCIDASGWPDSTTNASQNASTVYNRSYWKAMDGGDCVSTGIHCDTLQLQADGQFKISHRTITHTWTTAAKAPVAGAGAGAGAGAIALPPPAPAAETKKKDKTKKKKKKKKVRVKPDATAAATAAATDATGSDEGAKKENKTREARGKRKPKAAATADADANADAAPVAKPHVVCRFFKDGKCRNGSVCPFVHEKPLTAPESETK